MCGVSRDTRRGSVRALSEGSPFVFDFCLSVRTHRESVYLWKVVCNSSLVGGRHGGSTLQWGKEEEESGKVPTCGYWESERNVCLEVWVQPKKKNSKISNIQCIQTVYY